MGVGSGGVSRLGSGGVSGLRGRVVRLGLGVLSNTLVADIGDVARVGISNVVGHNLGAAVREVDTVFTIGGIVVAVLVGSEVGTRVVISNSIAVLIDSGAIRLGLMVGSGSMGGLVGWGVDGGLVGGGVHRGVHGGLVGRGVDGSLVGGSVNNRGLVSGSMDRGGMDNGGMVSRSVDRGVVSRGVDRGLVSRGMDRGMVGSSMHLVGRGMVSGGVLLLIVGLVNLRRLSRRLAHNGGMGNTVGLVDRGVDGRGIAVLHGLVAGLVSIGSGQEGKDGDESLLKKFFESRLFEAIHFALVFLPSC